MHDRRELGVGVFGCGGYLDGGAAPVLPCVEGVGGGEGSDCFDDVGELCLGSVRSPWARACVGSSIVGE